MEILLRKAASVNKLFRLIVTLAVMMASSSLHAQVYWEGDVSTDFYTPDNWSDNTINYSTLSNYKLIIGAGNPNNCVYTGSNNTSNSNLRANFINTKTDAQLTVNGALYSWNSDSLNGKIVLNTGADFNTRNYAYIGRNSTSVITINGGAFSVKNGISVGHGTAGNGLVEVKGGSFNSSGYLDVANGVGLTGQINITGGAVNVTSNLNIGTNGRISISGIGLLKVNGDKQALLSGFISSGKIVCPPEKTLSVVFDGAATTVSIPQDPNSMLREYPDHIILKNEFLEARIDKYTSNITSLKINGIETVNTAGSSRKGTYYDFTSSKGFETIFGATFSAKRDEPEIVDVSFKRPYVPGSNVTPCDADIHYVLKKGDTGLYTYSILEHKPEYPAFDLGSWRQVMWIAPDPNNTNNYLCEKIYVDSLRNWQMPSLYDFSQATVTGIQEIVKLNTGVRAGKYDGKYEYCVPAWETPFWGHASDVNHIGSWFINSSLEYYNEGPPEHDLNAAAGIIHNCLNSLHYNDMGFVVNQGESWSKIYGPYLIYTSLKQTGDENWADAKARTAVEKAQWPYSWLTNTPQYPLAHERGSITGRFIINDPFKPTVTGKNAWVGVTIISNPNNQWQFEEKNYQYWVKTDAQGNFTIPHVRPGTSYTFIGYSEGAVGDYQKAGVSVTAGNTTDLGDVIWNITRNKGNLVWEIGRANRRADEFKFGDFDYCEGYVQDKFASTFPAIIEYDVASKDWANKLSYVHSPYVNADKTLGSWKWRLNFSLPATTPVTGNAILTIAYASSDHAQQWIYVNNENSTFTTYYPENGGGNAFLRQTNYAKYSVKEVSIPMSRLKPGANTITLLMPSTSNLANHVMYDYISLEANVPVTLPVSLTSYHARPANEKVRLSWDVAAEQNNERFDIERSLDGKTFTFLTSVKGKGTSSQPGKYEAYDNTPQSGKNYYRLVQYDRDGTANDLGVRVVDFKALNESSFKIYPNPSEGSFSLTVPGFSQPETTISIYTSTGSLIYTNKINSRDNIFKVDLKFKPVPGEYILKLDSPTGNHTGKIIFK